MTFLYVETHVWKCACVITKSTSSASGSWWWLRSSPTTVKTVVAKTLFLWNVNINHVREKLRSNGTIIFQCCTGGARGFGPSIEGNWSLEWEYVLLKRAGTNPELIWAVWFLNVSNLLNFVSQQGWQWGWNSEFLTSWVLVKWLLQQPPCVNLYVGLQGKVALLSREISASAFFVFLLFCSMSKTSCWHISLEWPY